MEFDAEKRVFRTSPADRKLINVDEIPEAQANQLLAMITKKFNEVVDIDPSIYPGGAQRQTALEMKHQYLNLIGCMLDVVIPHVSDQGIEEITRSFDQ